MFTALDPPIDAGENVDVLLAIADVLAGDQVGHGETAVGKSSARSILTSFTG